MRVRCWRSPVRWRSCRSLAAGARAASVPSLRTCDRAHASPSAYLRSTADRARAGEFEQQRLRPRPTKRRAAAVASGRRSARSPRPGQVPLELRASPIEQLIVGDGARALDLRRGPEPGHRAQARRSALGATPGGAARRRQRRRARFELKDAGAARRPGVGRGDAAERGGGLRAHPHGLRAQPAARRWSSTTTSARPPMLRFPSFERNPRARRRRCSASRRRRAPTWSASESSGTRDADLFAAPQPGRRRSPSGCGRARSTRCVGQAHLLGPGKPLRLAFESGKPHSMILWGPPGVGKTTLARLMAEAFDAEFIALSAVLSGVKDIREAVRAARGRRSPQPGRHTILFVDEVHRFNKAQQDAFLPYVEQGLVTFIGATTENPSFEVNSARCCRAPRSTCCEPLSAEELGAAVRPRARRGAAGARLRRATRASADRLRRRRCAAPAQPARASRRPRPRAAGRADRRRLRRGDAGAEPAPLRQGRRGVLRPDLGAAQVGARLGSRRRAVLAGAHARRRRRSALPRRGASCAWRRRTSASPTRARCARARCRRDLRAAGLARGRAGAGRGGALPGRARRSRTRSTSPIMRRARSSREDGSRPVPLHLRNAPTQADEGPRLRQGLPLRARRGGSATRPARTTSPRACRECAWYQPTERGLEAKIREKLD